MSTSGILLVAKTKEAHQYLQAQFIKRKVEKYYEALIENSPTTREGEINLPLRLDIEDRPKQMVCYEHGKEAKTIWTVLERRTKTCFVKLRPITGRTHQLRVHCAHKEGLDAPIIGDDLYGTKKDRLYLHAAFLKFRHPISKEMISFYIPSNF
jgi:tRNA pseudouridine32 synthase/23S rRNA pseudouridine746 synthase